MFFLNIEANCEDMQEAERALFVLNSLAAHMGAWQLALPGQPAAMRGAASAFLEFAARSGAAAERPVCCPPVSAGERAAASIPSSSGLNDGARQHGPVHTTRRRVRLRVTAIMPCNLGYLNEAFPHLMPIGQGGERRRVTSRRVTGCEWVLWKFNKTVAWGGLAVILAEEGSRVILRG